MASCVAWIFALRLFTTAGGSFIAEIVMTVVGLLLIENLFRNSGREARWAVKYLCFGIGGILIALGAIMVLGKLGGLLMLVLAIGLVVAGVSLFKGGKRKTY